MSRLSILLMRWRAGMVLTCLLALFVLACAPLPTTLETDAAPAELAAPTARPAPGTAAPLQLLVFHSPL